MPGDRIPEPWHGFFAELDCHFSQPVEFHCLGGFVVTMLYKLPRATADVDVVKILPLAAQNFLRQLAGPFTAFHKKQGIYIDVVGVVTLPIDYDLRLIEMFPGGFSHLRLFALDPYDLALSKLERNAQRDRDDVKHLARTVPLDLAVLRERFETELKPDIGNPEREALTLKLWIEVIEEERERSANQPD